MEEWMPGSTVTGVSLYRKRLSPEPRGEPQGHRERALLKCRQLGQVPGAEQSEGIGWDQKEVQQEWTAGG